MHFRRRLLIAVASALLTLPLLALGGPAANASSESVTSESAGAVILGGCNWGTPCGEAQNGTPWGMQVTTTLGSGSDRCDVWNQNGGSSPSWWHAPCTQEYLAPGGHRGGGNVDVDAFTFNDRGYYMTFQTKVWHGAGVWTKITNLQDAECRNTDGVPNCWIS